ncbi:hypothetical protein KNO34_04430 [Taylorella equigenitalis]|uniref:hypothetical protein n=1 Tax=Taylorella equigenitalis TaxID=29575 RepID=UPI00237D1E91|nr:hypothetical protein [Taylorella equigenitalis]WDU48755.1 hypothetical protein KNO34_04430 [Taylorella equigenitalis]WDU51230.1 hypothetical protein KNO32_04420 [Taylorella equigenitalis]
MNNDFFKDTSDEIIIKHQKMLSRLFMKSLVINPEWLNWISENWKSIITKKKERELAETSLSFIKHYQSEYSQTNKKDYQKKTSDSKSKSTDKTTSQNEAVTNVYSDTIF